MFSHLLGGFFSLIGGIFRFVFFLLRHPLYVVLLLALFTGLFYVNGVPPEEIAGFIGKQWHSFVDNRKKTFGEDMQIVKARLLKNQSADIEEDDLAGIDLDALDRPQNNRKEVPQVSREEVGRQMQEETFGWQKAFDVAIKEDIDVPQEDQNALYGVLSVVGADTVSVQDRKFQLKVKLRSGKAGDAYEQMKRQFDGRQAKCLPDENDPQKADCFVDDLDISELLIDKGLADPN